MELYKMDVYKNFIFKTVFILFSMCAAAPAFAINSQIINEHVDASGKITVAVFERIAGSQLAHFNNFAVEVPDQFVVIGGGVEGTNYPSGNLLTASYPNSDLSAWLVSTKDHLVSNPTQIKAWAIGLKIEGLTRQQLINNLAVNVASSSYEQHPDISTGVPAGFTMIGGGFKVNWSGTGNLATASYPENAYSWRARSKDHIVKSPAVLQVWAIGIRDFISGVGNIVTDINFSLSSYAQHPAASANITPGYALSACGALVNWSGVGNLLWKIKPVTNWSQHGCEAASKDHNEYSPATIETYAVGIMAN
jgi:hypothetical protein